MHKKILTSLAGLLLPLAGYGSPRTYGGYQRRQSSLVASSDPLPSVGRKRVPAQSRPVHSPDGLDIIACASVRELVIIDAAVPQKDAFYQELRPGVEVIQLTADVDGLTQLKRVLAGYRDLQAVHIVSHAHAGALQLGASRIDARTVDQDIGTFAAINGAIRPNGDLLFYGCNLAASAGGDAFLEILATHTHADLAASDDLTGNVEKGGDWELEIRKGQIEAEPPFSANALKDFHSVLFDQTITMDGFPTGYGEPKTATYGAYTARLSLNDGDPDADSLYCVNGYGYGFQCIVDYSGASSGDKKLYFDFTGGETFSVTSLYLYTAFYVDQNLRISSDKGHTIDHNVLGDGTGDTIALNWTGITRITIEKVNGSDIDFLRIDDIALTNIEPANDSDGTVTAGGGVLEPVGLATTADTVGEATDVFDFTITDGGTSDGVALTASQVVIHVSGTSTDAERNQVTWRLNGPDAANVSGTYDPGADTITFSGLSISVADAGNETYTINAYYNDNIGLTDGHTFILSLDGDTDLTLGGAGTKMASGQSTISNGAGTTADVVATQLVFTTQPAGSVSGAALTTQPVVAARDAFGNTDVDFTETVTLTSGDPGELSNGTQAATNGVATFTALTYQATVDQELFTLTANDQDGVGSNLSSVQANAVTADVVATKLVFTTQPAPTTINSGAATTFSTAPVVSAVDGNNLLDTGYGTGITVAVANGAGSATLTGTGDTDGNAATVSLEPASGAATFTGLEVAYTVSGSSNETFNLRASSGGLTTADSNQITATAAPTVTDANISISGATGAGGAYIIGDTVTATWNNTAGGDNNDGIAAVTVDFTAFGGGAAVAAVNSSGTWTATYTIVAGAIDATNRNVAVTATDGASNATTAADTSNATVDNIAPTAAVVVDNTALQIGATSNVTITFSEAVSGLTAADLTVANGSLSAVSSADSGVTWTGTLTPASDVTDPTNVITLDMTGVIDAAGNPGTGTTDSNTYAVDTLALTVTDANVSLSGATGIGGAFRIGDTVTATWNNTADGDNNADTVDGVTVDFTAFGGGAAVAATNSAGTWTATYTIVAGATDATDRNISVTARDGSGNVTTAADTTNATVDAIAPTLTDANLSISGATGTGGAFKIGDTVTATWNNTAGGDNNVDTISGVTVDFSALGGATVAATNSAGTWTATAILTAGAIDATNRNVVATATDNAGNATTTADTSNATVDTVAPTITDANVSISGGSGTGGTYKIGDTVTATWNNTAGGDNNSDTLAGVTVDFTAFGGGAAVAATDSAGTWTATYTLTAGAIDAENVNVSVSAVDDAGNATTTADTTHATVDNLAPAAPSTPDLTAETDTGVSDTDNTTSDTTPTFSGTADVGSTVSLFAGATLLGTATASGGTWTITSTALAAGSHTITATARDAEDNTSAASAALAITVDTTAPDLQSVLRQTPTTVNADTASLTWRVTFDSDVSGVDTADFALTALGGGTATGTVASVTAVDASTYDVVVNALGGQGQLRLDLDATGTGIADLAGQALADGGFTAGDLYFVGASSVLDTVALLQGATVNVNLAGPNQPAQRFTTSGVDPLSLTSVTVAVESVTGTPSPVVTLRTDNAGTPGTAVATLTNPATLTADALNVWTGNVLLDPNTVYWIVFAEASGAGSYDLGVSLATTGGSGAWLTDTHPAADSDYLFRFGSNSGTSQTGVLQMALGATSTPAISSALISNGTYGAAFTYTITASNTPTSYAATGLPAGLSLDPATGAITGAPTEAGTFNVNLTATNGSGAGAPSTLVLTIAKAPLTITANDAVRSFGAANPAFTVAYTGLVGGDTGADLATAPTVSTIADASSAPGTYDLTVAGAVSTNYTITYVAGTLTINAASQSISFPAIGDRRPGETVVLTATASSGLPVSFSLVSGNATLVGSTLTIDGGGEIVVRATQAGNGNYQAATSVVQTIHAVKVAQTIAFGALPDRRVGDPAFNLFATASSGLPVTFAVTSGPAMLSGSTLTLTGVPGTVVVTATQAGDDTYAAASSVSHSFAVAARGPQIFFGLLGGETIAAQLSPDGGVGTLIGMIPGTGEGFVVNFSVGAGGTWTATATTYTGGSSAPGSVGAQQVNLRSLASRRRASKTEGGSEGLATASRTFRGTIRDGVLSGTIDGLDLEFTADLQPPSGPTAGLAGYYEALSINSATGSTYSVVGTEGRVYVLAITASTVVGSAGEVAADGSFSLAAPQQVMIVGHVDAPTTSVTGTVFLPNGQEEDFSGVRDSTLRTDRLINLSTRARSTGTGSGTLITGFVIGGSAPKQVLLRGVGPTLAEFNVGDPVSDPRLRVFNAAGEIIAENDNWSDSSELAAVMQRVGAFAFPGGSRDAALLMTLDPGAYTMHVLDGGAGGVALAEIYDSSANPQAEYQRLVNISSRGTVSGGEGVLIGGFIVTGNAPKRVLVRGSGPALVAYGVVNPLSDPQLLVLNREGAIVARNDNWETPLPVDAVQASATAAEITAANRTAGAFPFAAGSADAALIVTLAPGAYTAQVAGANQTTGVALIEIYELIE